MLKSWKIYLKNYKIKFVKKLSKKISIILISLPLFVFATLSDVTIEDNYKGFFVLKKKDGFGIEIKNDFYPDDVDRLIVAFDFEDFYEKFGIDKIFSEKSYPRLNYIWDEKNGRGVVKNQLDENRKIYTTFSRFKDDNGFVPKGLFVGGGLPHSLRANVPEKLSDTGMAYFDGNDWFHIWCSANEGISAGVDFGLKLPPSLWKFEGSKILKDTNSELIIKSSHSVDFDNSTMKIERYAFFKAGEPYFILVIKFKNIGKNIMKFIYVYGDEPWIGEYGTSAGDVGWVEDGLILHEGSIDIKKYNYVGFYDYGNDAIGETHYFTKLANFIEWIGDESKPDLVYFSNEVAKFAINRLVPLYSNNNRNLGIEWGPKTLKPGESITLTLAIGMVIDYTSGYPKKPNIYFDKNNFYLN